MCGIAGFTKGKSALHRQDVIDTMTDLLQHRGPDGRGVWLDARVALGHRRLAILDLSGRAAQPMVSNCGRFVLTYNGEIYNYRELQAELEHLGHHFRTTSDTEVLLAAWKEWGMACVERCNGMFAFAIYDSLVGSVTLVRDRLGIKPLVYAEHDGSLLFASEAKSLLAYPHFPRRLNRHVIDSYFQHRYIVGEETLFSGVRSVPPGVMLEYAVDTAKTKTHRYWELPAVVRKDPMTDRDAVHRVRELVTKAIQRRLVADVPVGAYLSGGLDSSIITGVMAQLRGPEYPVETFTIGFAEEGFNEFPYGRSVSARWKTNHHEILLSAEHYLESMQELIRYKDAPLAVPNEVPLYRMSQALKEHITVVLSGEGADELFGGYGRIMIAFREFERSGRGRFLDFFLDRYRYVPSEALAGALDRELVAECADSGYTRSIFTRISERSDMLPLEDRVPFIFQQVHLQGLLQRVDATTMATAVEARVPFVDHELVEAISAFPFNQKIRWKDSRSQQRAMRDHLASSEISEVLDVTKYVLRNAFTAQLPNAIISRKKVGFPVPLDRWFHGDFGGYARDILFDEQTRRRSLFSSSVTSGSTPLENFSGTHIWMMLNLELFCREFFSTIPISVCKTQE
jgi:asparagine synthase (glutamine-hydrolysing)